MKRSEFVHAAAIAVLFRNVPPTKGDNIAETVDVLERIADGVHAREPFDAEPRGAGAALRLRRSLERERVELRELCAAADRIADRLDRVGDHGKDAEFVSDVRAALVPFREFMKETER